MPASAVARRLSRRDPAAAAARRERMNGGLGLLAVIVALMWIVEIVNTLDGNGLDHDGILARNVGQLWGVITSPFLHASFAHLIGNTIPLVFMGAVIALRGAARLALVTGVIVILGGLGTWLIGPAGVSTIGASGVVFGYAAYVLTRGLFDRSLFEAVVGLVVAVLWGGALLSSVVPHPGISWQAHLCGAIAGVVAAWLLAPKREPAPAAAPAAARPRA